MGDGVDDYVVDVFFVLVVVEDCVDLFEYIVFFDVGDDFVYVVWCDQWFVLGVVVGVVGEVYCVYWKYFDVDVLQWEYGGGVVYMVVGDGGLDGEDFYFLIFLFGVGWCL